jgi:uroporphyrinogen III methyltransferase / synthase
VNGVVAFFERLKALGKDARALHGIEVGAIGPATADALKREGIMPDFVPTEFTSDGIIAGLGLRNISGKHILLPRADIADAALVDGLRDIGADVDEVPAYHTAKPADSSLGVKRAISSGEIDVITFASSSTVSNLMAAMSNNANLHGTRVACIGPKTAETARRAGLNVDILARESTVPALVEAIEEYYLKEK